MVNLVNNYILTPVIHSLNELRKQVGNKIVFLLLNLSKDITPVEIDKELISDILYFYTSKYSKDKQNDLEIIKVFDEYINHNLSLVLDDNSNIDYETRLKSLRDFYDIVLMIISILNDILNFVVYKKEPFKTSEFFLLSEIKDDYPYFKSKITSIIKDFLESLVKIRGSYISEDLKDNILKVLDYIKNGEIQGNIQVLDELYLDIIKRNQDYEYYIISKDKIFTVVPSSYIWFEFLMHIGFLYEDQIEFISLEELYNKRLLPSFQISKIWYKTLYDNVMCEDSKKAQYYDLILNTISELEFYLKDIFEKVKNSYPEKVEMNDELFVEKLKLLYEKTEEIQKLNLSYNFNSQALKGTGIFENFYQLITEIYSERESLLSLHEIFNFINNILINLEELEPDYITPIDRKILENKSKFETLLDYIFKFIQEENKDYLIDILHYFKNEIEPIIVDVKEDTQKMEKLLEPEKIMCVHCGTLNDPYNEVCINCGKKLIKSSLMESQGLFTTLINKLKKLSNKKDLPSYVSFLIKLSNNTLTNMSTVKSQLEQVQNETVHSLLEKINIIIDNLYFIREKVAILNAADLNTLNSEMLEEIITQIEPVAEELEKDLKDLYSFVKSFANTPLE